MRKSKPRRQRTGVRNAFETRLQDQLINSKVKHDYETEKIPYVLVRSYIPDFILETLHGKVYIEAKGYFRREAKSKMVAVKRQNPGLDIRIVFYKYSKEYERWAIRNGFLYAFEYIPEDWLTGDLHGQRTTKGNTSSDE